MTAEDYDLTYDGTVKQDSHLRGQVEGLADRMPTSDSWEMAARNSQMADQQAFLDTLKNEQSAVHNDLRTMKQAVNQRLAQQTLRMQYASASLMKEANGGTCTPQDIQWWNSQTGAGGKNKGAVLQAAGYDDNGNFNMVFVDPTTKAQSVFTASQLDQYQMANNMPGIFSDQDRFGMHDALLSSGHSDQELSKYSSQLNVIGGANITHDRPVSANVNLTTGEISSFGGRPGPRARFWSKDDFNGRPYRDPEKPGERYLGHGISSFSTADWYEDREEKREPNGRWVQTAVGPSDTFDGKKDTTQVRTYKNTKTGEVVRVKDGETPPWRKDPISDRLRIAAMNERGRNERNAANNEMRLILLEKQNEERKALREQNKILRQMQQIAIARDKELDPKKKAEYQAQYDALQKKLVDVPDADESVNQNGGGSGTPAPTGAAAAIAQGRKGRSEGEDTPVKGAKPQAQTTTKQEPDNADDYDFGYATADSSTFRYCCHGVGEEDISEDDYKKLTKEQRASSSWRKTYARDGSPIFRRRVYGKRIKKEGAQTPAPAAAQTEGGEGDVEKGNLSHKGRKWKFYTDKDGKVNGYGTTRSMVAKTDDGRYAVIPTIVNGEELSADEAVKHFKETGEHWGIAKSEDAAKKLANKVHLEEQEGNMKEWNDWLHNNWDKVSPEITNDEGMAKEHQRRESQKYEQKISEKGEDPERFAGIFYPEELVVKKKELIPSDWLKNTTPYDYQTTGIRAKSDEQIQREADAEKPILTRPIGVARTPEEKKFGEAATAAMISASLAAGGKIGKLVSLGITVMSAKRILDGKGTIEDGVALATALIGAGYSAKAAYSRVKGFGIELNNAAMERAASTARTNNNRAARTMPKPTPKKTVKSTGYSNADETLAYTRIKANKASLDKLVRDGYVEKNNWFTSDKLAKGTKSVFDDTVGKMEGSGAKGEFKNAIITVKKDKVGDGKVAPKLSDLDGIWVSKGGKKVNILPDILEQHRKSASAAKRIGNVVGEKIGQHRAKQIYGGGAYGWTGMRGEIVDTVISELKRRRGFGKHVKLSQVETDRITSRAQSVFDEINRKSGGKDPATMGSDEIQKIIIDNTISPEGKIY